MGTGQVDRPAKFRAFIAVRVGDEVEGALARLIDEVRAPDDGIAWVPHDKLHVTLKFLGTAIDSAQLPELEAAIGRIVRNTSALQVYTRGIGAFPNLRRPRVLWAGLESDALPELAKKIETAAADAGFDRADRPWAPHLTIGRVRDPRKAQKARARLESASDIAFGDSLISEVSLYRSHLSSKGSTYEQLAVFPFRSS